MAVFGQYQTEGDPDRSGLVLLWPARRVGEDGPPRFTVAVLPALDEFGEPRPAHQTEAFLDAAHAQQRAAEAAGAEGGAVAAVHEIGRTDEGAYYVQDALPRSIQKLAVGRVRVESPGLANIVRGIVRGLQQFARTGRPHGNLRPNNVLIGAGDLAAADVRLSDPAADAALEPDNALRDRQDLGRLLYLLVVFRPYRDLGGWPIEASPDWARLGDDADLWRGLCNDLLDPHPTQLPDLDEILRRVSTAHAGAGVGGAGVPGAGARRRPLLLAGVGVVAIAAAAGLWFSGALRGGPVEPPPVPEPVPRPEPEPEVVDVGPDPRPAWEVPASLAPLRERLADLETRTLRISATPEVQEALQRIGGELRRLEYEEVPAVLTQSWGPPTADQIRAAMERLASEAGRIDAELARLVEAVGEAERAHAARLTASDAAAQLEDTRRQLQARERHEEDSAVLSRAWRQWRDELIERSTDAQALGNAAATLWQGLRSLEEGLPLPQRPRGAPPEAAEALRQLGWQRREAALQRALDELRPWRDEAWHGDDPAFAQGWQAVRDDYAGWVEEVQSLVDDLARAGVLLASGHTLDEPSAEDGPGAIWARWEASPTLAEVEEVAPELIAPVAAPVARLRELAQTTDAGALRAVLDGPLDHPAIARAAWARLGEVDPPRTADDLAAHIDLSGRAAAALEPVPEPKHREALRSQIAAALKDRAVACLSGLTGTGEIERAPELAERAGLSAADLARLPPGAHYNLLLADFRADAAALQGKEQEKQLRERLERFVASVEALEDVATQEAVAGPLGELQTLVAGAAPITPEELARLGPGAAGWTATEVDPGGAYVVFAAPGGGASGPRVRFQRVEVPGPGGITQMVYLSTAEVTVDVFTRAVAEGGLATDQQADELMAAVREGVARGQERRRGPGAWVWRASTTRDRWLTVSMQWIVPSTHDPQTAWAQANTKEASLAYPMHWLSPSAAAYAAQLLGCRLPTAAEWAAARAMAGRSPANRRDAAWGQLLESVRATAEALRAQGAVANLTWPDGGIFWPPGVAPVDQEAAQVAVSINDGAVFFSTVDTASSSFVHLEGNIAEYVTEGDEPMPAHLEPLDRATVDGELGPGYARVRVIGASALSPPEVRPEVPYNIDPVAARRGYSDVGFRLAFPAGAPAGVLAGKVQEALASAVYISPR